MAIADVSHYVKTGTALDVEARRRATSVYFPGRVVPMLPEELSNGLCSLKPEVDRLALVCEMEIGRDGALGKHWFFEAVIRSADHIQRILDQSGTLPERPAEPELEPDPVDSNDVD